MSMSQKINHNYFLPSRYATKSWFNTWNHAVPSNFLRNISDSLKKIREAKAGAKQN
jgi:hypothetical protein